MIKMPLNSAAGYADALQHIEAIHARDTREIHPVSRLQLLTHGRTTPRAILLWHGYTNSPRMYYQIAQKFFDLGYNVWTPRLPHAGLADRLTDDHARLTRDEIVQFTNETIDAARGLGNHLTVGGESLGGVMTAWAAQCRAEVDLAVMINSAFAMNGVPEKLNTLFARMMKRLPNIFMWWDPRARANTGPAHTYPRFSTRALAQTFLMGAEIYRLAQTQKPAARSILSITSAKDVAVNNRVIAQVVNRWRANGANVSEYQFQGVQVPVLHDIIDPTQPNQHIDYFYPILIDLITKPSPSA
jgi:alpha-beta hydrolase superfamily lysophospholipase